MLYRPEIDGLRAIAVLSVVLFHAGFAAFPGGFLGVDVFFVISGYLITSILLAEIDRGDFDLIRFYERRGRRILPALCVVLLICMPLAWWLMLPLELEAFGRSVVAVGVFFSNFHFWGSTGYFSPSAEKIPLLHTWSLGIEEQFYLIFPLMLLLITRLSRHWLPVFLILVFSGSLGLLLLCKTCGVNDQFYLPQYRVWELLLGALTAQLRFKLGGAWVISNPRASVLLSGLGLAMICSSVAGLEPGVAYPAYFLLLPTVGTAIAIFSLTSATGVGRLLALRPLVLIGLCSYSFYLFHQPAFVFARLYSVDSLNTWQLLLVSVGTFLLAYLSWRFVELPFRNRSLLPTRRALIIIGMTTSLVIMLGFFLSLENGHTSRFSDRELRVAALMQNKNRPACHSDVRLDSYPNCRYGPKGKPVIALLGDSHANNFVQILREIINERQDFQLVQLTYQGCLPVAGLERLDRSASGQCQLYNKKLDHYYLEENVAGTLLVVRWPLSVEGSRPNNLRGGVEHGPPVILKHVKTGVSNQLESERLLFAEQLAASLRTRLSHSQSIIAVYPVPEIGWEVPRALIRSERLGDAYRNFNVDYQWYRERTQKSFMVLDSLSNLTSDVQRIYPHKYLCEEGKNTCKGSDGGKAYYVDSSHLSQEGAALMKEALAAAIDNLLVREAGREN